MPEREMFGRYILLERLAVSSDGMSEIYKAQTRDPAGYSQLVLLKRSVPRGRTEEQWLARVTEDAYSFMGVEQPSLVQITDMGRIGNYFFLATEYVDAPDLGTVISRCLDLNVSIPLECIALIGAALCDALDTVHRTSDERGIPLNTAHLGISPKQVRVGWNGAVKLVDLISARLGSSSILTNQGMVQGNFPYMAPEQARVDYMTDIRSDIFLVGATLYECLALQPLYRGADQYSLLNQIGKGEYEPLTMLRRDVPRNLERVITKALSREPGLRYANCIALREDLLRVIVTLGTGDADYSTLAGFMSSLFSGSGRPASHWVTWQVEGTLAGDRVVAPVSGGGAHGYYGGGGAGYYGGAPQGYGGYDTPAPMAPVHDSDMEETIEFQPHMLPGYEVGGGGAAPYQAFDPDFDSEQTVEFDGEIQSLYEQDAALFPQASPQYAPPAGGAGGFVDSEETMEYDQHVAASLAREFHGGATGGGISPHGAEGYPVPGAPQAGAVPSAPPAYNFDETMELSEAEIAQLALDDESLGGLAGGGAEAQPVQQGSGGFWPPAATSEPVLLPGAGVPPSLGEMEEATGIFTPVSEGGPVSYGGPEPAAGVSLDDQVLLRASAEDGEETLALKRELVKRITRKSRGGAGDLLDDVPEDGDRELPASLKGERGGFVAFMGRNRKSFLLGGVVVALLIGWLAFIIPFRASLDKKGAAEQALASASVINIVTTPPGAAVELDGEKVEGVTPLELKELEPGKIHKLKVTLEGYKVREESVTVNKDERKELALNLDKLTGELVVVTAPVGAEVFMDGETVGKAPVTLSSLPLENNPVIKVKLKGYKDSEKTAVWSGREQVQLDFTLEKEPPKPVAKAAPPASSRRSSGAAASRRGSQRASGRTGAAGAQVGSGMGLISVHAIPWASVFIDNRKFADETPIIRREVKAGRRSVKVFYPSLNKFSAVQTVIIKEGEEQRLIFKE